MQTEDMKICLFQVLNKVDNCHLTLFVVRLAEVGY